MTTYRVPFENGESAFTEKRSRFFQVALHQGQPHLIFFLGRRLHIRADIPGIEPFHKICHPKNHLE